METLKTTCFYCKAPIGKIWGAKDENGNTLKQLQEIAVHGLGAFYFCPKCASRVRVLVKNKLKELLDDWEMKK